jgi:hypothetical protein
MVKIIATQRIPYGKRRYEAGEEIPDVSDKDAKLLVGIGKAKLADARSPTDLPKAALPAAPVEEAAPEAAADPRTDTARHRPDGWPDWRGQTVAIIASGPSAKKRN